MIHEPTIKYKNRRISWQVLSSQATFFHERTIATVEQRIKESRLIKKGHRRAVYFHAHSGFYIKQLIPSRAKIEWRNWTGLRASGMPTVTPIALGLGQQKAYIISRAHDDFRPLYDTWHTLSGRLRLQLLEALGRTIRRMHESGYYHGDLHGGNFIVRTALGHFDLKMLDFQSGSFKKITRSRKFYNLADISLSHFFQLNTREKFTFLKGYLGSSSTTKNFWRQNGRTLEHIILKRASHIADRNVKRFRKINKYFGRFATDTGNYRGVYLKKNHDRIPDAFLASPIPFMRSDRVEVYKDSRSVRVVRYKDICIKYYKRRGPKDNIKGFLGLSKARKSLRYALAMQNRYINTPEPFCFLEGKTGDSYYLCRLIEPPLNLTIYLRNALPDERHECRQALAVFLNRVFYRGVYHMDLKGSNILTLGAGGKRTFYLIDSDEVVVRWQGSRRLLRKCLLRITRGLTPFFSRQELCDFVTQCLTGIIIMPHKKAAPGLVEQAIDIQNRLERS